MGHPKGSRPQSYIRVDRPDVVISALWQVVNMVRSKQGADQHRRCRARGGRRSSKGTACRAPTSRVKLLPFRGPPGRIIACRARGPSAGSALHQAGRRHLHPGLAWARGVGGDQAALNNFSARARSLPNCRFRKCLRARKENTGSRRGRTLPSARIRRASRGA